MTGLQLHVKLYIYVISFQQPTRTNLPHTGPAIAPRNLRIVTDNMLQGLGRHLRCCGIDVVTLDQTDDHDKAAKVIKNKKIKKPVVSYIQVAYHAFVSSMYKD